MRPRLSFLCLLLTVFVAPLAAVGPYLGNDLPNAALLLPPPPPAGSDEDVADRDAAFHIYSARTQEQLALGTEQQHLTPFHLTAKILPWFQPGKFPKTEALLKAVENESYKVSTQAKRIWNRPRPFVAEPERFTKVIEQDPKPSSSYPSGHALRATLFGAILAELFPEQRNDLLANAARSAWLRVQGGVHTPLDIYAGRTLGQATAQAFLRSEAFQSDLAEAKAELAAAKKP